MTTRVWLDEYGIIASLDLAHRLDEMRETMGEPGLVYLRQNFNVTVSTTGSLPINSATTITVSALPTGADRLEKRIKELQRQAQRGDREAQRDLRLAQLELKRMK